MNLLIGLIVFACVMLVIAVIGHGLWIMAASFGNHLLGTSRLPTAHQVARPRRRRACPGCETALLPIDRDCPRCGLVQSSRLAAEVERVRFALREVAALADRDELDAETS